MDTPVGEKMEEDAILNIYDDKTDDDAGGCWKTLMHKGRARQTHAKMLPSENVSDNPDASQLTKRKRSRNKNLPPLPLRAEKIIQRPHGGLCLDKWTRPELANALWSAVGLSNQDRQDIIFPLRPQQNLAIISTPHLHLVDALYKERELSFGQQVYLITTYFAAPDNSYDRPYDHQSAAADLGALLCRCSTGVRTTVLRYGIETLPPVVRRRSARYDCAARGAVATGT
ncbi:hypothetical protein HPB50_001186 [Hyalomma asiaticum]|uniref:Uncharacterized protein n=1 Tax=Hyalomma asiaticum TaxID=266040 RepID=A0ACB7SAW8_HYAAI|nr:hypothetical protein HPB50_001186 [Hyalomma asiaticum]